ncbi:MAG: T9SS type A sorting domain-containing protein [Cyclobacteriaceae bacterium]
MTKTSRIRLPLLSLLTLFTIANGLAQTLGDYRSTGDGNWNNVGTWQRWDGSAWVAPGANGYPGQTATPTLVTIQESDDVTLNVTPTFPLNNLALAGRSFCFCGEIADNTSLVTSGNPSLTLSGNLTATAGFLSNTQFTFSGTGSLTISGNTAFGAGGGILGAALTFNSTGTFTTTGSITVQPLLSSITISGGALVMSGNLSVGAASTATFSTTGNITIAGSTTIGVLASLTDNNNTGTSIFGGQVTLNTGTWTSSSVTTESRMIFRGGIANNDGTFTGGGATFNTNNQSITGNSALTFNNNVAITAVTVNCSNSSNLTISGTTTLSTSGGFTDSNDTGITTLTGNVSVGVGTSFVSTAVSTTANMIFRGGISQAGTFTAGGATFNTNSQSITGGSSLSFANDVAITGVTVTNSNTGNLTITGTTTLSTSGGFTDSDNTGVTTLIGRVTVNASTSFISTVVTTNPNMVFRGGITNNGGTFTAGAGTFNVNDQSLLGNAVISFANFVNITAVTVTNDNTAAVSFTRNADAQATLTGTGRWTQGANSTLNYSGSSITVSNFNANANPNTVNYNVTTYDQAIRNATYHHLTLSGTGNRTKTLSANTLVNGNLSIQNTAIFSVGTFSLSVAGNWSNTSTNADPFVQGTQTVTLNGTAAQTITNTGDAQGTEFNNLTINNTFGTAPQVTLNNATIVRGALTLTQGIVSTSTSALLTLVDNATSNGGDADSYVDGPIRKIGNDAFTFPTGDGTIWARIGISAPATATTEFTAQYFDATSPFISEWTDGSFNDESDVEYWTLDRAVTTDAVQVTLFWENNARSKINSPTADLIVARYNSGVTMWTSHGQSAITSAGATGNVTSNAVSSFSQFTFGSLSVALNPLPIELVNFTASPVENSIHLNWTTASELNNDYFTVERSADGETFSTVGEKIKGAGTTNQARSYNLVDQSPLYGTSYYRLKQTDFDGTFSFSKIISVTYDGPVFPVMNVYPNPTKGDFITIKIEGLKNMETVPVIIYDQVGKAWMTKVLAVDQNTQTAAGDLVFDKQLPKGMYLVKAGPSQIQVAKFVVYEK